MRLVGHFREIAQAIARLLPYGLILLQIALPACCLLITLRLLPPSEKRVRAAAKWGSVAAAILFLAVMSPVNLSYINACDLGYLPDESARCSQPTAQRLTWHGWMTGMQTSGVFRPMKQISTELMMYEVDKVDHEKSSKESYLLSKELFKEYQAVDCPPDHDGLWKRNHDEPCPESYKRCMPIPTHNGAYRLGALNALGILITPLLALALFLFRGRRDADFPIAQRWYFAAALFTLALFFACPFNLWLPTFQLQFIVPAACLFLFGLTGINYPRLRFLAPVLFITLAVILTARADDFNWDAMTLTGETVCAHPRGCMIRPHTDNEILQNARAILAKRAEKDTRSYPAGPLRNLHIDTTLDGVDWCNEYRTEPRPAWFTPLTGLTPAGYRAPYYPGGPLRAGLKGIAFRSL